MWSAGSWLRASFSRFGIYSADMVRLEAIHRVVVWAVGAGSGGDMGYGRVPIGLIGLVVELGCWGL